MPSPVQALLGSRFILGTSFVYLLGWILAIVGWSDLSSANVSIAGLIWFSLVLAIFLWLAILGLAAGSALHAGSYRATLSHLVLLDLVMTAWCTDYLILFMNKTSETAVAKAVASAAGISDALNLATAGSVLLMMAQTLLILYLTAEPSSAVVSFLEKWDAQEVAEDRAARRKLVQSVYYPPAPQLPPVLPGVSPMTFPMPTSTTVPSMYLSPATAENAPPMPNLGAPGSIQMPTPDALSLALPMAAVAATQQQRQQQEQQQAQQQAAAAAAVQPTYAQPAAAAAPAEAAIPDSAVNDDDSDLPAFTYRAQALFAYTASPDDPQEISFKKDEILEIANPHGNRWWQARNAQGQVGIAPSNYLKLLQ
ncbi:Transmembrane osmosensor [Allomyces arbusculus]|nr:Transmembrane osmosensor [Allomyces arbusculus]